MIQSIKMPFPAWVWLTPLVPFLIWIYECTHGLDQTWFLEFNHYAHRYPDILWTGFSLLGNGWSVFALALPLILFFPKALYASLLSGIFAGAFSHIAKSIADTLRPAGVLDTANFYIIDNPLLHSAMPSGHTITAFSIATAIYFSIPTEKRGRYFFLFLLATVTGLSRIAVGAHWPQDVLVGSAIGILCGLLASPLVNWIPQKSLQLQSHSSKVILAASLVSMYFLVIDTLDFKINQTLQYGLACIIAATWIYVLWLNFQKKSSHRV